MPEKCGWNLAHSIVDASKSGEIIYIVISMGTSRFNDGVKVSVKVSFYFALFQESCWNGEKPSSRDRFLHLGSDRSS